MNPIMINAHLLKIPLQIAQTPSTSRNALEKIITLRKNVNKMRTHVVQSYFTPFVEIFLNPFIGSYNLLDLSRKRKLSHLITNSQLNVYRNYCHKATNKTKRSGNTDDKKKDKVSGEDCISFKREKVKKIRQDTMKTDGISFNVNLNEMINELAKKKDLQKLHEINKINNFIFKSIDCKTCSSKKKKSSGKSAKANQQKRSNSSYSLYQKMYPKYEMKRKEFMKKNYEETVNYNSRSEVSSLCLNKYGENYNKRPISLAKEKTYVESDKRSKGPVPLFMLIKCNSGKTRAIIDHYSNNIKYKVGTNEAFIKSSETILINKKNTKESNLHFRKSRSEGDIRQNNKLEHFFDYSDSTEKTKLYRTKSLCGVSKPVLATTIYKMLKPLIEQEFLQYQEVKTAIHRIENNLEIYLNQSIPDIQNINPSKEKNEFDLPINKKEIREPNTYSNIIDPSDKNHCKKDPVTSNVISAPSTGKLEIFDPTEYEIVIIAENCSSNNDKSGCDDPCSVKLQSNSKSDDTCKKSTTHLCDDDKKRDPCKKEKSACEENRKSRQKDNNEDTNKLCLQKLNSASEADESKKKHSCQKEMKQELCKKSKENETNTKCVQNKSNDACEKKSRAQLCEDDNKRDPCKKDRSVCKENQDQKESCSKKLNCAAEAEKSKKKHPCQEEMKQELCKKSKENETNTKCESRKASANCNDCFKTKKKVDPCDERNNLDSSKEVSCKNVKKKDDPCRRSGMEPNEEIFKKAKHFNPLPCCEEASISQEPKLPSMKPASKSRKDNLREKSDTIEQVCTQRSCTQRSMESNEPPNCCKPLARKGFYDKPCPDVPHRLKEVTGVKQVCCEELIKKEREAAKQRNVVQHKALPPKKVDPPIKRDPPSKTETRYCTKPAKKSESPPPSMAVKCTRISARIVPQNIEQKPIREPKQAPKDSWLPVKIRTKKMDPGSCECKPGKCSSSTKDNLHPSRSPKLSAQLPKSEHPKKGLFSSICQVFGLGKKKTNKRGVSSNTIGFSMQESRGVFGGLSSSAPAGLSGNRPGKKPGTMTFAIYRKRNRKYPWNVTPRWSVCHERFFSKKAKEDSDPCKSKKSNESEENEADSNKLQCICYEEIRKQTGIGKTGGSEQQLIFKPTNHSKICQMEGKKKPQCESGSHKPDQGKGEKCSSDKSTTKQSINVCAHKLKISETSTKNESKESCAGKPGSDTKQENKTKKRKTFRERCNPKSLSKEADCTKKQEQSKGRAIKKNDIKNKYPWKKSDVKINETLCANESFITKKSMEQEKARKKTVKENQKCSKGNMLESESGNSCFQDTDKKKKRKQKCETKNKAKETTKTDSKKYKEQICTQSKSQKNKDDKIEVSADKKESVCDKLKKNKRGGGKECFMTKKSGDDEPKGVCEKIKEKEKSKGQMTKKCADDEPKGVCEKIKEKEKSEGRMTKKCGDDEPKGVCEKIKSKEKSKGGIGLTTPQKCNSVTEANTEKINKISDDSKDDMFICKVKSLGKSEQLICSSGNEQSQEMKLKEKGVLRLLKCKKIKDEFGRDVYICKEVKPDKDRNAVLQEELQQMKNLLKQSSLPNLSRERTIVGKKLVCHKKPDGTKECHMEEVKEIVEGNGKTHVKSAPKKCPISYQDLLKRSDEVRKAESDRTIEEKGKRKDVKKVANIFQRSSDKKIKDC